MIKEIFDKYKLLKYSMYFKRDITFCAIFIILGIAILVSDPTPVGGLLIIEVWMFVCNMITGLEASSMVVASPERRKIFLNLYDVTIIGMSLITTVIFEVIMTIHGYQGSNTIIALYMFFLTAWMIIYLSVVNKSYVASMIFLGIFALIFVSMISLNGEKASPEKIFELSTMTVNCLGFATWAVANVIGFVVRRLVYKMDMSPVIAKRYAMLSR